MKIPLTQEEIKEIAARQLTPREAFVLQILLNISPIDLAILLGTSRQYVHQTRDIALKKLIAQGVITEKEAGSEVAHESTRG